MRPFLPLFFIVAGFFFLFPLPGAGAEAEENRIVAVVNDEVVTQSDLNRALAPIYFQLQASLGPEELSKRMEEVRQQVIQQLIDERLMLQEARDPRQVEVAKGKIGSPPAIEVSEEEVLERMDEAKARFQNPEEFSEALRQQGLTEGDLRARFREQIAIQRLISREVRSRVTVSPTEVTAYYESNRAEFKAPPAVQAATIFIHPKDNLDLPRARAQAEDLLHQLQQGADFYDLARRYSDGFNSQMGGRMGFLERGKSRKEVDDVLFSLKPGEVSSVIQTAAGFHLFLAEAVRPERQAQLAEVQEEIKYHLLEEKGAIRYKQWVAKLREDSYISVK